MKKSLVLGGVILNMLTAQAKTNEKPNVIFIMSDDHTSQAFGVYNSRLSKLNPTPTIDRIGKEGIIFDNAFCTNSISTPSRANIISGQYSQTNGVLDLNGRLDSIRQFLPQELAKNGYQTAVIGKWHLKELPKSFDYYNVFYGQGKYFDPVMVEKGDTSKVYKNEANLHWSKNEYVNGKKYYGHSSDIVTDQVLNWLEKKRDPEKPFFLMHQFKAPHDMFEFNPKYKEYLEDVFIPEPANMYNDINHGSIATKGKNGKLKRVIGSSVGHRNLVRNMGMHMNIDPNLPENEYKHLAYQEYLKRYLRCVKGVDDNVKRLFDYLEKHNLMDNTIIIYTGDQGFYLGEHDYIDKRWMYEESMRMPFLVRYPKMIKAGQRTNAIVNNVDFAPTIIDLIGGMVPEKMQGESFKEILVTGNEPKDWKKDTYYRYWMHMAHHHANPAHFGIRTKKYKLIFFYGVDFIKRGGDNPNKYLKITQMKTPAGWEFYDLKNDPQEMNNCYNNPKYKSIIQKLKDRLKELRKEINEEDQNYPHIQKIIEENWN
jgi:uncharacterized sulfatase